MSVACVEVAVGMMYAAVSKLLCTGDLLCTNVLQTCLMCTSGSLDVPDVPDSLCVTNLAERLTLRLAYRLALPNNHIFAFGACDTVIWVSERASGL